MTEKETVLYLEDGTFLHGKLLGSSGTASGEVVFNTAMSGYQEIITDPSYYKQFVTFTYPHIGNYGINDEDIESKRSWVSGVIIRKESNHFSSWRGKISLNEYLEINSITGIKNIDTRFLTKHLRDNGSKIGVISSEIFEEKKLKDIVTQNSDIMGTGLVNKVTAAEGYYYNVSGDTFAAVYDFGVKNNILRSLTKRGCKVYVAPAETPAEKIIGMKPDFILLSNGPGDPAVLHSIINNIKKFIGRIPVFGICLGHQIIALACGSETYKLKFGHHGGNHPVKNLITNKIEISVQNHNYAVDRKSAEDKGFEVTHINLNDNTVEGLQNKDLRLFSLQYHPEASPGPHDSENFFDFILKTLS